MKLILASSSTGRRKLLTALKVPFEIVPSKVNEDKINHTTPKQTIRLRAKAKAENIYQKYEASRLNDRGVFSQLLHRERNPSEAPNEAKRSGAKGDKGQNVLILAADSMVILKGLTMGKPKDIEEAKLMLKKLSGTTHQFTTAFYIVNAKTGKIYQGDETSTISFNKMTNEEIEFYSQLDDLTRYAGAYSLFDSPQWFVSQVKGSIGNIVGLPLEKVIPILKKEKILTG